MSRARLSTVSCQEDKPVYTSPALAALLVAYFWPTGLCLDPCRGRGAFFNALPEPREWCEIREGRDFFQYDRHVSFIATNPPWQGYAPFAERCFRLAENVVFLVHHHVALGMSRRRRDWETHAHRLKEVIRVDWADAGFTYENGSKKQGEGADLVVCHWQRHWRGGVKESNWTAGKIEVARRLVRLRELLRRCEDHLGRGAP